jgi:hypothetical protein
VPAGEQEQSQFEMKVCEDCMQSFEGITDEHGKQLIVAVLSCSGSQKD